MAVDLMCYTSVPSNEVEVVISRLKRDNEDLFNKKFVIYPVREAKPSHKETSMEYGLDANSLFLISLNDKSAADRVLYVVDLVKGALGEGSVVILHGNSVRM